MTKGNKLVVLLSPGKLPIKNARWIEHSFLIFCPLGDPHFEYLPGTTSFWPFNLIPTKVFWFSKEFRNFIGTGEIGTL